MTSTASAKARSETGSRVIADGHGVRHLCRRTVRLPRQDMAAIAQPGRRHGRHAAELSAAHQPDRRIRRQRKQRGHDRQGLVGHVRHRRGLLRPESIQPLGQHPGPRVARIAAASNAAFTAPARPMASVPTGMPAGICTIDSRLSMPFSACDLDRHAQHRQRRPGGAHARQMRRPAGAGDDHLQAAIPRGQSHTSRSRSGVRWAETILTSCGTARRVSIVGRMRQRGPVRLAAHDDADQRSRVARSSQAMLSGISRLSSQAISSRSISLRFFSRCRCNWSDAPWSASRAMTVSRSRCSLRSPCSLRSSESLIAQHVYNPR